MDGLLAARTVADARRSDELRDLLGDLVGGLLAADDVTDITRNEDGTVRVTRLGEPTRVAGSMSDAQAAALVAVVASTHGTLVNAHRPSVAAELVTDGSRFQGVIPPVVRSAIWAIRRPASRLFPLAEYVAKGAMTEGQADRLRRAVQGRENLVVVGGTGSGKSTLLNAIAHEVAQTAPHERMALIEQIRELRIDLQDHVRFRLTDTYTEQQALADALRLNIDRIWVGEVRRGEALDMLMCWNTGHDGGACSLHARTSAPTPRTALVRIEQMCGLASAVPQHRVIGETIDLIVCIQRDPDGRRFVSRMATVHGWDGADYQLTLEQP